MVFYHRCCVHIFLSLCCRRLYCQHCAEHYFFQPETWKEDIRVLLHWPSMVLHSRSNRNVKGLFGDTLSFIHTSLSFFIYRIMWFWVSWQGWMDILLPYYEYLQSLQLIRFRVLPLKQSLLMSIKPVKEFIIISSNSLQIHLSWLCIHTFFQVLKSF